jgi:uncharacterized protein YlzI (FlbEa/FlbD family)
MNFITLTKYAQDKANSKIKINPIGILALEQYPESTTVTLMNGAWSVKESLDEIEKLIEKSKTFKIINYDNGKSEKGTDLDRVPN